MRYREPSGFVAHTAAGDGGSVLCYSEFALSRSTLFGLCGVPRAQPTTLLGGSLQLVRRFRLPALFCALTVLCCELISRPYANMGVCDDGPYILMAQHLARTGHVAYNGWAAPMLGWQLYLGAAFIKLFGFSLTTVRCSTLLVALVTAWLLQRTLVLAGITERNATLGTLAFVLSPLYLMLSATYMTDMDALLAVVVCLYACLRALRARTGRATIFWLCFAVVTNAIFGTARQIAWLGILVMVPSTLYLLQDRRRALVAGVAATAAGAGFIFACMQWLKHQPYLIPEHVLAASLPAAHTLAAIAYLFADLPFLLLPLAAIFTLELRRLGSLGRVRPWVVAGMLTLVVGYLLLALHWRHLHPNLLLEPTMRDWVNIYGIFEGSDLQGVPPIFLSRAIQIGVTAVCFAGVLGLVVSFLLRHAEAGGEGLEGSRPYPVGREGSPEAQRATAEPTSAQLCVLVLPFALAYTLLLVPRAAGVVIYDRYALELLPLAVLLLLGGYQRYVRPQLPLLSTSVLLLLTAALGVAMTHNNFAYYRARAALAAELRAAGVPDTQVDNGWEYNSSVEIRHAGYVNDPHIVTPADAYTPAPPPATDACPMHGYDGFRLIHPLYGVSFDPNACYGPAPFAPVHYSRWPFRTPGTLYVVRYLPAAKE